MFIYHRVLAFPNLCSIFYCSIIMIIYIFWPKKQNSRGFDFGLHPKRLLTNYSFTPYYILDVEVIGWIIGVVFVFNFYLHPLKLPILLYNGF